MSDAPGNEQPVKQVELVAWHRPALGDGLYQITVRQQVSEPGNARVPAGTTFTTRQTFQVEGNRFSLVPADIQEVFPPDGNLGDHASALPHVVLERSTLPWERSANGDPAVPWLALLLFSESEAQAGQVREPDITTLGAIKAGASGGDAVWPPIALNPWQSDDDKVAVIDVRRSLLAAIAPNAAELGLLAHVRRSSDGTGQASGRARSVIVCNRLPQRDGISIAHLVSVEGRYDPETGLLAELSAPPSGGDPYVRLVTLKSWRFACVTVTQNFLGLLQHLDSEPAVLRLPLSNNPVADGYLSQGYVAVPYTPRKGSPTVAWYRGPLIPCASGPSADPDARAADTLLRYDPALDMFDISYAAAWERGRLLLLQSKAVSVALYNWKRAHAQEWHQGSQPLRPLRRVAASAEPDRSVPPSEVSAWFEDLLRLRGVPINYLVAAAPMLPPESIRFFQIDDFWLDCLLDGAFSIGQTTTHSDVVEQLQQSLLTASLPDRGRLSGVLLRSEVVSGWPALQVEGSDQPGGASDDAGPRLLRLRMDRIAPDVMFCLFAGVVRSVSVHLSPEALHLGTERLEEDETLRGRKSEWLHSSNRLALAGLAAMLKAETSADVARSLIMRVPRVLFAVEPHA